MTRLRKVTLEYDDRVVSLSGSEAEKWLRHSESLAVLGAVHGMNPFDTDPVQWEVVYREREQEP